MLRRPHNVALLDLFLDLFDQDGLRVFLYCLDHAVLQRLPRGPISDESFAVAALLELRRLALIEPALFDALVAARPAREAEIRGVQRLFEGKPALPPPAPRPGGDRPLELRVKGDASIELLTPLRNVFPNIRRLDTVEAIRRARGSDSPTLRLYGGDGLVVAAHPQLICGSDGHLRRELPVSRRWPRPVLYYPLGRASEPVFTVEGRTTGPNHYTVEVALARGVATDAARLRVHVTHEPARDPR